jgi:hypothetical protein
MGADAAPSQGNAMNLMNRHTPQETLTALLVREHADPGHPDPDVLCPE